MSQRRTVTLKFKFPPRTKGRPRLGRRGRVFTPAATQEFEALVLDRWKAANMKPFVGPVRVSIRLSRKHFTVSITQLSGIKGAVTGDCDNYAKSILDGLQGPDGAFLDDRQVMELAVRKDTPA